MHLDLLLGPMLMLLGAKPYQANQELTIYTPGPAVSAPQLVSSVTPPYTAAASRAKLVGEVTLSAVVFSDGTVGNVTVTQSCLGEAPLLKRPILKQLRPASFPCVTPEKDLVTISGRATPRTDPSLGLNDAAATAATRWVFKPAIRNGQAVAAGIQMIMEFRLGSAP
jgi:outer membrane biosynthesis protein TonB